MKQFLEKLPKTSIATIIWAIIIYSQWKWYIDTDFATLISTIMVALWLWVNITSGKFNLK